MVDRWRIRSQMSMRSLITISCILTKLQGFENLITKNIRTRTKSWTTTFVVIWDHTGSKKKIFILNKTLLITKIKDNEADDNQKFTERMKINQCQFGNELKKWVLFKYKFVSELINIWNNSIHHKDSLQISVRELNMHQRDYWRATCICTVLHQGRWNATPPHRPFHPQVRAEVKQQQKHNIHKSGSMAQQ